MNSKKYAGWEIEKTTTATATNMNEPAYFMTRPDWEAMGIRYGILVSRNGQNEWAAESLVWVERLQDYIANKTSEYGPVPAVVKEIERRAAYWMSKR